jgi:type VI secretion system secreted protein VgrG
MTTASLAMRLLLNVPSHHAVVSCRLTEGLSERTHAEIEIASHDFIDFEPVLGDDVTITLDGADSRRWTLKLGRAAFLEHRDGSLRFRLDLYDAAWLLGLSKNTRKFRNMSAREIAGRVLDEGCVPHRFQIAEPPQRKYCSQYRETNLAFVERLLEFEGIYYTFDGGGVMVLGDRSDASPLVREAPFELIEAAGALARGEVGIHALRKGRRVRSGRVTLGDHNWKKPKLVLCESSAADRDTQLGRFEYPAGYRLPDQGSRLAQMRLEAERAQAVFIEGKGNVPAFAPGSGFSVGFQSGDLFAGSYLIVRVEHRFDNGDFQSAAGRANRPADTTYENHFTGMPLASKFRPMPRTPRPRAGGTHTATVRGPDGQAIHTDKYGRFRAQFHWDRDGTGTDEDSRWIRALQETATSMTLARTGWEVFVGYIDGDPDRPVGLGRAINGVALPTYALPGHKNMMAIRTPSVGGGGGGAFNEIKMDDSAGSQAISIRAEKDLDALVKNEKTEKVGHSETHFVGTDFSRQVVQSQELAIGADATASFGANHRLSVVGSRVKKVGGSEEVKIGKDAQTRTGGDETEKVGSLRLTVAGAIKLPDSRTFAQMATNLGMGYLRNLAPGLTAAVDSAQSIANKVEALQNTGANPLIAGVHMAAQAGAGAGVAAFLGGTEQGGERGALAAMAGSAASAAVGGEGGDWIGSAGLQSGAQALLTNPEPTEEGRSSQGGLDAAGNAFAQSFGNTLDRVLPTQQELGALVPSESWIPNQQTFDQANAALPNQLRQMISVEGVTSLLCSGGIGRNATSAMHKLVGGAYITVALLGIDTRIGSGYIETVGGIKLTLARSAIREDVSGKLYITVGGAIRRHSICYLVISSGANSSVSVGALASYESAQRFDVLGDVIKVNTKSDLAMKGGDAEMAFDSSSVKLKGKMKLTAGKSITLIGGSKLDVTK